MQEPKIKFKIFKGNFSQTSADEKLNQWLDEHPNAEIITFDYVEAHYGNHSICLAYTEE